MQSAELTTRDKKIWNKQENAHRSQRGFSDMEQKQSKRIVNEKYTHTRLGKRTHTQTATEMGRMTGRGIELHEFFVVFPLEKFLCLSIAANVLSIQLTISWVPNSWANWFLYSLKIKLCRLQLDSDWQLQFAAVKRLLIYLLVLLKLDQVNIARKSVIVTVAEQHQHTPCGHQLQLSSSVWVLFFCSFRFDLLNVKSQ